MSRQVKRLIRIVAIRDARVIAGDVHEAIIGSFNLLFTLDFLVLFNQALDVIDHALLFCNEGLRRDSQPPPFPFIADLVSRICDDLVPIAT